MGEIRYLLLLLCNGAPNKSNDALRVVLGHAVLQCQLRCNK